ncbi:UNVERIFIED_CONTAM: hypothetical protein HDU68_006342 [Siphonaria sp. JEL0065]|nr:hypothetical protein HDU68_006342 [Siphonaria sp. JEL0065]
MILAERELPNPFFGREPLNNGLPLSQKTASLIHALLASTFKQIVAATPPNGSFDFDCIYGGSPGILLLSLRLASCRDIPNEFLQTAQAFATAFETRHGTFANSLNTFTGKTALKLGFNPPVPSAHASPLFSPAVGFHVQSVLLNNILGDHVKARASFDAVLEAGALARDYESYDEICWGRSGFLLGAYPILKDFSSVYSSPEKVEALVFQIADAMVKRCGGTKVLNTICYGTEYYGVAHGIGGVILSLLQYPHLAKKYADVIHATLRHLISIRLDNGNWPVHPKDTEGEQMHWCHGAPGLGILFVAAAYRFPDTHPQYMIAALSAGEITWERGLLKKGVGLCHGVAGNGYLFLYLHKVTGDAKWFQRAACFAEFACGWEKLVKEGTMKRADMFWSLFEGVGGACLFWADVVAVSEGREFVGIPCSFQF